jgi:rhamnose utilization protein RhaD (predicted bifunctional aldolase and dehydrogenase)
MKVLGLVALAHDAVTNQVLNDGLCPWCVEIPTKSVKCLLHAFMPSAVSRHEHVMEVARLEW